MTVDVSSKSVISFLLPAVAGLIVNAKNTIPTYAAYCAGASKFTATVNNWKGTGTATKITAGNCVINNVATITLNVGNSAADATNGATAMAASSLTFD